MHLPCFKLVGSMLSSRGTALNTGRTYGTHKNIPGIYFAIFTNYLVLFFMVPGNSCIFYVKYRWHDTRGIMNKGGAAVSDGKYNNKIQYQPRPRRCIRMEHAIIIDTWYIYTYTSQYQPRPRRCIRMEHAVIDTWYIYTYTSRR